MTGCDAIHPGYGFLSEDDAFADTVRAHGLTFIGPPAEVLERFASKAATRRLLAEHGLPTIPGSGLLRDDAHALDEAERIGYPVLVKPSAGGGGKGMRMVRSPRELEQALPICRSEARAAFGDDWPVPGASGWRRTATSRSRSSWTATATASTSASATAPSSVATRRSSRRRPTPALGPGSRRQLCEQAVRAVVAAGYENVGTLEFLVDAQGNYFFIEINCRIQVEHPVTEMLSGIDMVASRSGSRRASRSGYSQADVQLRGHAIEFRITAEDVAHDFRPQAGTIERVSTRRADRACGWTRTCTPATRCRRTTTRCWGSSWCWGPDRRTAIARAAPRWPSCVVEGVDDQRGLPPRDPRRTRRSWRGTFTTNLLDRVGAGRVRGRRARLSAPRRWHAPTDQATRRDAGRH